VLTAIGAYQLEQALLASRRLAARDVAHTVVYLIEPARFRAPACAGEEAHAVRDETRSDLYPADVPARVFLTHTRPGPLRGVLHRLDTGERTVALGFQNRGGTLDVDGLLFVNRSTWAHVVDAVARLIGSDRRSLLEPAEIDALDGRVSPHGAVIPEPESG
jgi:phosphoketolase